MNATFAATLLRWLMLGLIVAAAMWALSGLYAWIGSRFGSGAAKKPAPTRAADPAPSEG